MDYTVLQLRIQPSLYPLPREPLPTFHPISCNLLFLHFYRMRDTCCSLSIIHVSGHDPLFFSFPTHHITTDFKNGSVYVFFTLIFMEFPHRLEFKAPIVLFPLNVLFRISLLHLPRLSTLTPRYKYSSQDYPDIYVKVCLLFIFLCRDIFRGHASVWYYYSSSYFHRYSASSLSV